MSVPKVVPLDDDFLIPQYRRRPPLAPGILAAVNGNWVYPTNWYWIVADTFIGTKVWQSATGQFVPIDTADYVSYITFGFKSSVIDTSANLFLAISCWNIE